VAPLVETNVRQLLFFINDCKVSLFFGGANFGQFGTLLKGYTPHHKI
jgi:hypothetical protein